MKMRKILKNLNRFGHLHFRTELCCIEITKVRSAYYFQAKDRPLVFKFKNLNHVKRVIKTLFDCKYIYDNKNHLSFFLQEIIASNKRERAIIV